MAAVQFGTENAMQPIIQVRELAKTYDNGLIPALNGVTFDVREGGIVAVAGPSGCGKTTLLTLLGGLDVPSSGTILVQGRELNRYKPLHRYRTEMVGFVFQFHHLIPSLTLLENVELPLLPLREARRTRRSRASDLLETVGLADRMHVLPTEVSGGERQRAAIARALVNNPRILLADEPTGNLDTLTGEAIISFLTSLCRDRNTTLILVTHNPEIAAKAERVIYMKNGRIDIIRMQASGASEDSSQKQVDPGKVPSG